MVLVDAHQRVSQPGHLSGMASLCSLTAVLGILLWPRRPQLVAMPATSVVGLAAVAPRGHGVAEKANQKQVFKVPAPRYQRSALTVLTLCVRA